VVIRFAGSRPAAAALDDSEETTASSSVQARVEGVRTQSIFSSPPFWPARTLPPPPHRSIRDAVRTEPVDAPHIGRAELSALRRAVASLGFELAPRPVRPRDPAEPVAFAAEYIYHRDLGETIYDWSRGVYFTSNWPRE
jgi:hypothetical protein